MFRSFSRVRKKDMTQPFVRFNLPFVMMRDVVFRPRYSTAERRRGDISGHSSQEMTRACIGAYLRLSVARHRQVHRGLRRNHICTCVYRYSLRSSLDRRPYDPHRGNGPTDSAYRFQNQCSRLIHYIKEPYAISAKTGFVDYVEYYV